MSDEKPRDLTERTKASALWVMQLYAALPQTTEAQVIGPQLLRSGTPMGANHRDASRARSRAESAAKLRLTVREADETAYGLELLTEARSVARSPCGRPGEASR